MREGAEMLGGNLRIDSEPGAGTRVEMGVPLDARLQRSREGVKPAPCLRRLQGLVVALGKHKAPAYATGAKCCGKDTRRLVAPAGLPQSCFSSMLRSARMERQTSYSRKTPSNDGSSWATAIHPRSSPLQEQIAPCL